MSIQPIHVGKRVIVLANKTYLDFEKGTYYMLDIIGTITDGGKVSVQISDTLEMYTVRAGDFDVVSVDGTERNPMLAKKRHV